MIRRRQGRPDFDALTEAQLIAGRTTARRVYLEPLPERPLGELLTAIDHVAEAATGERSFLHLGPKPGAGPATGS